MEGRSLERGMGVAVKAFGDRRLGCWCCGREEEEVAAEEARRDCTAGAMVDKSDWWGASTGCRGEGEASTLAEIKKRFEIFYSCFHKIIAQIVMDAS